MTITGTRDREEGGSKTHLVDDHLIHDERRKLVQRIVASSGFQRAAQLRAILLYVTEFAIQHEGDSLREYDIARDVLHRRSDFDPTSDNIVRVQASHLRRKLEQYFSGEGRSEPVVLSIPKGSYVPHFHIPVADQRSFPAIQTFAGPPQPAEQPLTKHPASLWRFAALFGPVILLLIALIWTIRARSSPATRPPDTGGLILHSLLQHGDSVGIVLPDVSLVEIETFVKSAVTIPQYTSTDFPNNLMDEIEDPAVRQVLSYVGHKRATSTAEASIAATFMDDLKQVGGHGVLRYARDLHVRDLGDGNLILIGSPRSNPWVSLFSSRSNFSYFEDNSGHYFLNAHPKPGELPRYLCNYSSNRSDEQISYVDVALLPNLTNTGFVLLINGADVQANEAAALYLLHGRLPASVVASLSRNELKGFELFLKGAHLENEADSTFEIVSFRLIQD